MLVSIVIPCYNSEHTIGEVVDLCMEEFAKMDGYECSDKISGQPISSRETPTTS